MNLNLRSAVVTAALVAGLAVSSLVPSVASAASASAPPDLAVTLAKANGAGATVLVQPFTSGQRESALVQFPGGYIAEIHATVGDGRRTPEGE